MFKKTMLWIVTLLAVIGIANAFVLFTPVVNQSVSVVTNLTGMSGYARNDQNETWGGFSLFATDVIANTLFGNLDWSYLQNVPSFFNQTNADLLYYPLANPTDFINKTLADTYYYPLANPNGFVNMTGILTSGIYIYNNGFNISMNETKLNTTILALADDFNETSRINTTSYLALTGGSLSGNVTMLNNSFTNVSCIVFATGGKICAG